MTSSGEEQTVTGANHGRVRLVGGWRLGLPLGVLAICLGTVQATTAFLQVPDEPSPENGTSQVVAQGVIDIPANDVRWQIAEQTAGPPANAPTSASDTGFLVVDSGVLLTENLATGEQQRLPAGEVTLTLAGADQVRVALGSESAVYRELALVDATGADAADESVVFSGEPFAGPGARHDIDLLQNSLAAGASMTIPTGALPTLVLIESGIGEISAENGDVFALGAGEAIALGGPLVVTATEDAIVTAAYTGPAVPLLADQQGTPVPSTRVIASPGPRTPEAAEPRPTATATVEPPADETEGADDDADGLTGQQEIEAGTDPSLSDTDEDGLTDGQEELEIGTSPLTPDTDGDGVLDGDEVAQGTNPLEGIPEAATDETLAVDEPVATEVPTDPAAAGAPGDSDGDGLEDAIEIELGTDAFDLDTDDDGLTDGDEYYVYATGTRNPDSDGDGVTDGTETANGTNPNDPGSF